MRTRTIFNAFVCIQFVFITLSLTMYKIWFINHNAPTFSDEPTMERMNKSNLASRTGSVTARNEVQRMHVNRIEEWKPADPWDPPPDGFYNDTDTGSFQNCLESSNPNKSPTVPDDEEQKVVVSCHTIRYRALPESFQKAGRVIVGVLSSASGKGPERRSYIRSTWAHGVDGVFFLVGGPWEDIEREFNDFKDLIWIDEDEVYEGEKSVLPYKTVSYFNIAHKLAKRPEDGGFLHAFKTDDDSYLNMELLKEKVLGEDGKDLNYYGEFRPFQTGPYRDQKYKWPVSYGMYPEPKFPL